MASGVRTVVAAPMSFAGSAGRALNLLWHDKSPVVKFALGIWLIPSLLFFWWGAILVWYVAFGLLLAPYRLVRRGSRKRKREARMHEETLRAIRESQPPNQIP